MLALIEAINHELLVFAPDYVRPAQKAMMRIYRDTRFSKNKQPYKTNIAAWWARHGLEKTSGGGFYLGIDAREITIAAGCYMPQPDQLLAIRRHLSAAGGNRHADLRRILADKKLRALMQPFNAEASEDDVYADHSQHAAARPLTRAPKGFSPDDPALDLLLHRQWGVSAHIPAAEALKPTLFKQIVQRFKIATPLVTLLNEPLITTIAKPRPIF
jgi:uncharacterized protein (TIGR02453 family)